MSGSINFDVSVTYSRYWNLRWLLGQSDTMLCWMNFQTHLFGKLFINIGIWTCSVDDSRYFLVVDFHLNFWLLQTLRNRCRYLIIHGGYGRSLFLPFSAHLCPMTNAIATGTSWILCWASAFPAIRTLVWPRSAASEAMFLVFMMIFVDDGR